MSPQPTTDPPEAHTVPVVEAPTSSPPEAQTTPAPLTSMSPPQPQTTPDVPTSTPPTISVPPNSSACLPTYSPPKGTLVPNPDPMAKPSTSMLKGKKAKRIPRPCPVPECAGKVYSNIWNHIHQFHGSKGSFTGEFLHMHCMLYV